MKLKTISIIFVTLFSYCAYSFSFNIEAGANWQLRNDVKISSQNGTLVSFDEFDSGPFFHYRLEVYNDINDLHGIRLIMAPLSLSVTGSNSTSINFNDETYTANSPYTVNYKFNSYRLGYTYRLFGNRNNYFKIGITAKIRDADITLLQGTKTSTYDNLGFVPLFYYAFKFSLSQNWSIYSDADFASAKQGRALDVNLKLRKNISNNSQIGFGVRALEGGADNDKVLTFSFLSYAVLDFTYKL